MPKYSLSSSGTRKTLRHLILLALVTVATAISSANLFAQTGATAQISGQVFDPSHGAILGAKVTAKSEETGLVRSAVTNETGYILPNLLPGSYEITVEAKGFTRARETHLLLTVGQQATLNPKLEVASGKEEVTVTAEAPLIEVSRTELSQAIEERRIANLPINGRQFLDFALLTPNVATGRSGIGNTIRPSEPNQIDISFGGLPEIASMVTVDGANNMNGVFARPRSTPSQEGVREFRVLTNGYGSDVGYAAGAVVNIVTKAGSNEFHGSLYEYFRNNDLDAHNLLAAPGFDELRQNQYGVTFGGPAIKDKLFFFTNFEGQRRNESPFYSSVLLNNLGPINTAKQALGLPPEVIAGLIRRGDYDTGLLRGDYQISSKQQFDVSYRIRNESDTNLGAASEQFSAPSDFRNSSVLDHSLTANFTSTISAGLVNLALFQFADRTFDLPAVTYQPDLSISNTLDIGRQATAPDGARERRYEFADSINWIKGGHNVRLGGNVNRTADTFILDPSDPAQAIFPNLDAFLGRLPFAPGVPFAVVFDYLTGPNGERVPAPHGFASAANASLSALTRTIGHFGLYSLFAQDSWRLSPKLTLNYGLRWEGYSNPNDIVNNYFKAFLPRVGLAYSMLNDRIVFRAAGGVYQGTNDAIHILGTRLNGAHPDYGPIVPGFSTTNGNPITDYFVGPQQAIPAFLAFMGSGGALYPPPVIGQSQHFILGVNRYEPRGVYSYQWNGSFEVRLANDVALTLGYAGVRGLNIPTGNDFNVALAHLKLPDGENDYSIAPGIPAPGLRNFLISPISLFFNQDGQSTYHALNILITKRFSRHFSAFANYTWSKTIDDAGSDALTDDPQDPYNRHLERALSKQHVPQRLTGTVTGESPFTSPLLRGFRLSFLVTAQSPRYYTLFAGGDKNNDGNTITDRVGLVARNTYRGDKLASLDVRFSRLFTLMERLRLEAIAEAFNLTNTLNVTDLNSVYGSPYLIDPLPTHFGDHAPAASPVFGSIQATSAPRQLQFALKLTF